MNVFVVTSAAVFCLCATATAQPIHRTDFLTLAGRHDMLAYPALSNRRRADIRATVRDLGYTHVYLYVVNEGDLGLPVYNDYERPERFRSRLQELLSDGIAPVVWLAPDDAPRFHRDATATLPGIWDTFIPLVDSLVDSYVLGLEMDEYWSDSEQRQLGSHLDGLTARPIFIHYRGGRIRGSEWPWVDGIMYQYESPRTVESVRQETGEMIPQVGGKIFIAAEYSYGGNGDTERDSFARGTAALSAGADGVGNGVTLTVAPAVPLPGIVTGIVGILLVFIASRAWDEQ